MNRFTFALALALAFTLGCDDPADSAPPTADAALMDATGPDAGSLPVNPDMDPSPALDGTPSPASDATLDASTAPPPVLDGATDPQNDAAVTPDPPTCDAVCTDLAACLVDRCDGYDETATDGLMQRCLDRCTPNLARRLSGRTCDQTLRLVRSQDAEVDAACAPPTSEDGVDALYIGHSFGRPFAEHFTEVAVNAGIEDHTQRIVFSGGESGAPSALWANEAKRAEIQSILDGGDVDLLTMICCSREFIDRGTDAGITNWMDYALARNPETQFALALPWPDFPEDYPSAAEHAALLEVGRVLWHALIDDLRAAYPGVDILSISHGQAALELRARFERGELPDVVRMTGPRDEAIFTDRKGHAAQILKDLGTLVWVGSVYGIDVSDYNFGMQYETDLAEIAAMIIEGDAYTR